MPEDRTRSTPATPESSVGSATETHGANTNLSPDLQGGPVAGADQVATQEVTERSGEPDPPDGNR